LFVETLLKRELMPLIVSTVVLEEFSRFIPVIDPLLVAAPLSFGLWRNLLRTEGGTGHD